MKHFPRSYGSAPAVGVYQGLTVRTGSRSLGPFVIAVNLQCQNCRAFEVLACAARVKFATSPQEFTNCFGLQNVKWVPVFSHFLSPRFGDVSNINKENGDGNEHQNWFQKRGPSLAPAMKFWSIRLFPKTFPRCICQRAKPMFFLKTRSPSVAHD